ncbi:MAG: TonB-dependent receptor, partial [Rhodoferax sp.]|nr:TonB-dependent receptor [Rhodoferax sp.]
MKLFESLAPVPRWTASAFCFFICLASAQAQEVGSNQEGGPAPGAKLERVEISTRQTDTELRRRASTAKQVYGREELDKFGDTNVADVLQRLPGVSMQGNAPRLRGLGAGYTQILINGDPAPPGFALDQLDPALVERIEVSKGPTATQSAQAVAGTINIILKDAPKRSQRDLRLGSAYRFEKPTFSGTFTFGEKWGDLSILIPVSTFQWRGQIDSEIHRQTFTGNGITTDAVQKGDNRNLGQGINLGPVLTWRISDDETLNWQSFAQSGAWNGTTGYTSQVLAGAPSLDGDSGNEGVWELVRSRLQWVNNFSADERIELKAGIQASRGRFDNQIQGAGALQQRTLGDNREASLTQAGNYTRLINQAHSLALGWDLELRQREEKRDASVQGVALISSLQGQAFSAQVQKTALFVQDEWQLSPQWSATLGLRHENIATQSTGLDVELRNTSAVLTPMLHLAYKLNASGKDLIRASLTRSYKAPDINALLARPTPNGLYPDLSQSNTVLAADSMGNPALRPELATGLDMAYEKYLPSGGLFSVGIFYREINDLVRGVTSLQTSPDYATAPRWVSQARNFSSGRAAGLELELKGRAGELLPALFDTKLPLSLRAALNFYRSEVDTLPGPDNRLDGQQPWSGSLGMDYRFNTLPLTMGGNFAFTPDFVTRQSLSQTLDQGRSRSIDMFARWIVRENVSMRLALSNIAPLANESLSSNSNGASVYTS